MNVTGMRLPGGISIRPQRESDALFIERLFRSVRADLQLIDGDRDLIEEIIVMQLNAQTSGYGGSFPNALYFIVEKLGEPIGRLTLDFGDNEVRIIDVALIPEMRGKGFGSVILQALQQVSGAIGAPLSLAVDSANLVAKQLYLRLGFRTVMIQPPHEFMTWRPQINPMKSMRS